MFFELQLYIEEAWRVPASVFTLVCVLCFDKNPVKKKAADFSESKFRCSHGHLPRRSSSQKGRVHYLHLAATYTDSGESRTFSQSAASDRTPPSSISKSLSCSRDLPRSPSVNLESGPATASAPASGEDLRPPLPSTGHQIVELSFPSPSHQLT